MQSSARARCYSLLALSLAGCGERPAPVATVRVDTLRPGLIEVTSPAPTGWNDSTKAWTYRVSLTIQPEDDSHGELSQPDGIAVDEWGRIYVADRNPVSIKLFDSAGTFIRTIGRRGGGPGEYEAVFLAVRGGHLVVHDPQQGRTSVFDTSGTFVRSWPSSCCYWDNIGIDSAGVITVPSTYSPGNGQPSRGNAMRRFRMDGTVVDTLFVPLRESPSKGWTFSGGSGGSKTTMIMSIPFEPRLVKRLHPDGGFVVGWSGEYRILRSPRGEDTTAIYTRTWSPGRIPEEQRRAAVEGMVKNVTGLVGADKARETAILSDVPVDEPAFTSLAVDLDGTIFVRQLLGSDSTRTRFDVFSPDGAWLGTLTLPVAIPEYGGQFFGRRAIYVATEGEDGRPAIVRLSRTR